MATTNQIELAKLKETQRHNKAVENIDYDKLRETIRNNNLLHEVNVTKNEITRLANDQLNSRQLRELAEKMNLAYDQLNEEAYNNDLKVWIDEAKADLNSVLQSKKNTNDLWAALISATGRALGGNLKYLLPTSTGTAQQYSNILINDPQLMPMLFDGTVSDALIQKLGIDDPRYFKDDVTGKDVRDHIDAESDALSKEIERQRETKTQIGSDNVSTVKGESQITHNAKPSRQQRYKRKEVNEIPKDTSSSFGPGIVYAPSNQSNAPVYVPSMSDVSVSNHGTTKGGTDYQAVGGLTSSNIIYQGGSGNYEYK